MNNPSQLACRLVRGHLADEVEPVQLCARGVVQRAPHDAAVGRVADELRGARDVRSAGVVRGCRSVQIDDIVRRADDVARVGEAPLHALERSQRIERDVKIQWRSEVAVVRIYFDLCHH